jgi:hypothetical protein
MFALVPRNEGSLSRVPDAAVEELVDWRTEVVPVEVGSRLVREEEEVLGFPMEPAEPFR